MKRTVWIFFALSEGRINSINISKRRRDLENQIRHTGTRKGNLTLGNIMSDILSVDGKIEIFGNVWK